MSTDCRIVLYKKNMINNEFGENLKMLRIQAGLSQRELGRRLGFCNQTVSFWESGSREPDFDTLIRLAKFFDVSLDVLLDYQ